MTKRKENYTCKGCGKTFIRPDGIARSLTYHSTACQFWSKVNKTEGCWEWTGSTHRFGYGEFRSGQTLYRAHRYSYELHHGEIEEGLGINHNCDNPRCVNPDHLYAGTQAENMRDAALRDRVPNRKITLDQAIEIKALLENGVSPYTICKNYPISSSAIYNMVYGKTWKIAIL